MKSEFDHLIGKPFGEYGRGPDLYDCWGVVIESGKLMGEDTPDYSDISHNEADKVWGIVRKTLPEYEQIDKPVRKAIVLFMHVDGTAHFGCLIDKRYMIHTNEELGCHISSVADGLYSKLVKGFYLCKKQ